MELQPIEIGSQMIRKYGWEVLLSRLSVILITHRSTSHLYVFHQSLILSYPQSRIEETVLKSTEPKLNMGMVKKPGHLCIGLTWDMQAIGQCYSTDLFWNTGAYWIRGVKRGNVGDSRKWGPKDHGNPSFCLQPFPQAPTPKHPMPFL